jgi:hypothetical protein
MNKIFSFVIILISILFFSCEQPSNGTIDRLEDVPPFEPVDSSYTGLFEYVRNLVSKAPSNADGSAADKPLTIKFTGLLPGNDIEKIQNLATAIKNVGFYANIDLSNVIGIINIESTDFSYYLVGITLPDSVQNIGNNAFNGCINLSEINMPNGITAIGNYAFSGCTNLKNIIVPNAVNTFGQYVFNNCKKLQNIVLPESVSGNSFSLYYAFYNCENLESIIIPSGQPNISSSTFENCINLKSVILPEELLIIWSSSFKNCTSLTSIILPASIKEINIAAFQNCNNLSSVTFNGGITTFPNSLDITFPGDLESKYLLGGADTYTRSGTPLGDTWLKINN